jgi:hypothetical protein
LLFEIEQHPRAFVRGGVGAPVVRSQLRTDADRSRRPVNDRQAAELHTLSIDHHLVQQGQIGLGLGDPLLAQQLVVVTRIERLLEPVTLIGQEIVEHLMVQPGLRAGQGRHGRQRLIRITAPGRSGFKRQRVAGQWIAPHRSRTRARARLRILHQADAIARFLHIGLLQPQRQLLVELAQPATERAGQML